ncbi:hypothetical protein OJF2_09280 [Aquisphaera giovannonii]|uniref:Uncharacterized protein n=1 Tax=Aquisphaera giovannonii TaxID=406548 RepID=A0A5B9VWY4_9BACT|nr:hypothetical protein [Aquisphaera giovannonii]QEH32457.1 hypothetical protein OJF2_09280 [Aquisphaera giovannonii]
MSLRRLATDACLLIALAAASAGAAHGQYLTGEDGLIERYNPFKFDPSRPLTVSELCKRIDSLTESLRNDGLVAIKQPDVFSQARLTRFRIDFDRQFQKDLDQFQLVLAARINRLDAATTTQSTTLGAALSPGGSTTVTPPNITIPGDNASIDQSKGTFGTLSFNSSGNQKIAGLGVEPTVYLDEKRRFLEHLNEIRRISLGPDQNDSSGYGLYLVRMPVSITPGECTLQGHGADLSVTVEHEFTPDFLPSTFQNLIVNDLVDVLGPFIYNVLRAGQLDDLKKYAGRKDLANERDRLSGLLFLNKGFDQTYQVLLRRSPQWATNPSRTDAVEESIVDPLKAFILRESPIKPYTGEPEILSDLIAKRIEELANAAGADLRARPQRVEARQKEIDELIGYAAAIRRGRPIPGEAPGLVKDTLDRLIRNPLDDRLGKAGPGGSREVQVLTPEAFGLLKGLFTTALPDDVEFLLNNPWYYHVDPAASEADRKADEANRDAAKRVAGLNEVLFNQGLLQKLSANLPNSRNPKQIYPITSRDLLFYFGAENLYRIAKDVYDSRATEKIRATDVRAYLRQALNNSYYVLTRRTDLTDEPPVFADVDFMRRVYEGFRRREFDERPELPSDLKALDDEMVGRLARMRKNMEGKPIASYCWAMTLDAVLLDGSMRRDVERVFRARGIPDDMVDDVRFFLPPDVPNDVAKAVFNDYVKAKWPILTFSLDPVTDQQNIADSFNLKRDLQLALAYAFATGQVSFNQLNTFRRQLEQASDTIALNRTVWAYAHGNNNYGFRFTPRFQNPPNQRTNLGVITSQLIGGGPGPDYGLKKSKLEPGIRETTAILLLPTFLPTMRINVAGNWFKLHDPEHLIYHTKHAMEQGRRVQELHQAVLDACSSQRYRGDDLRVLQTKLAQLEAMLPQQSRVVQVPFENTASGFELFSEGATALVPELSGFEGIDEYNPDAENGAQILLYGKYFNILDTKVVAGGRLIQSMPLDSSSPPPTKDADVGDMDILSREVIRVRIPKNAAVTTTKDQPPATNRYVELYVATPNGISNRVLIPVTAKAAQQAPDAKVAYDLASAKLDLYYRWVRGDGDKPRLVAASDPGEKLGIKWTNSTGLAPRTLQVRFAGDIDGRFLGVTTTGDSGVKDDYVVKLRPLTVSILKRLEELFPDGAPLPKSITLTVDVQPYVPLPGMGYRVRSEAQTLPTKLQVNLTYFASGEDPLKDVKPAEVESASAGPAAGAPGLDEPDVIRTSAAAPAAQPPARLPASIPDNLPPLPAALDSSPPLPAGLGRTLAAAAPPGGAPTRPADLARVTQFLTGQPANAATAPLQQTAASPGMTATPGQPAGPPPITVNPPPQSIVVVAPKEAEKPHKKSRFHPSRLFGSRAR